MSVRAKRFVEAFALAAGDDLALFALPVDKAGVQEQAPAPAAGKSSFALHILRLVPHEVPTLARSLHSPSLENQLLHLHDSLLVNQHLLIVRQLQNALRLTLRPLKLRSAN